MAKRARLQLQDVLQRLSGDECAAEGSDDDLGMDDSYTASSDEGKCMYCYTIEQDDMDFDQPLPTCDPSSIGEASPSSLSREQLLCVCVCVIFSVCV